MSNAREDLAPEVIITRRAAQIATSTKASDINMPIHKLAIFGGILDKLRRGLGPIWENPFFKYWLTIPTLIFTPLTIAYAWRDAYLKKTAHSKANAVMTTLTGLAVMVVAIGIVAGITALSPVIPFIMAGVLAATTLFSFASAIHFGLKARTFPRRSMERAEYVKKAKENAFIGVMNAIMTAAAVTLLLVAAPVVQMAVTGAAVGAAALGVVHSLYIQFKTRNTRAFADVAIADHEMAIKERSTTSRVHQQFGSAPNYHVAPTAAATPPSYSSVVGQAHAQALQPLQPQAVSGHGNSDSSSDDDRPAPVATPVVSYPSF